MLRDKGLILLLPLLLFILLAPSMRADDEPVSHARMVHVSSVSGQVQISHQQGNGYQNATMNVPIVQGDVVRTGDDGWVEIQLENGSRIRLAPDSQMTFALMSRFASGSTATDVTLDDGEAAFAVVAGDDIGPFHVNVHGRVISLKRSSRFRVTSIPSDPLEVVVWRGEVGIFDHEAGQEVSVQNMETFTLDPQDVSHYDLEKDAQVDELDDWANQRDQALMAYADTHSDTLVTPLYSNQYSNPGVQQSYSTGLGYDPYTLAYDPYALGYGGFSPFGFGSPFGWGPWFWQPGFVTPIIILPSSVRLPHPIPVRPPVPPPAVKAAAGNPAFTINTDSGNRPVISNEHPPVQPLSIDAANSQPGTDAFQHPNESAVRRHPAVEIPAMAQGGTGVNTQGPHGHVSMPASHPYTPPARSFSPAPRGFSGSAAPAAHGGGGHK